MIISGEGKYKVWIKKCNIGDDRVFMLGGGEKSHIGGVVICEPDKKTNIIRLDNHYDYVVLKLIAEEASKKYNTKVVVTGGIHIDNATEEDIDKIVENCRRIAKCI